MKASDTMNRLKKGIILLFVIFLLSIAPIHAQSNGTIEITSVDIAPSGTITEGDTVTVTTNLQVTGSTDLIIQQVAVSITDPDGVVNHYFNPGYQYINNTTQKENLLLVQNVINNVKVGIYSYTAQATAFGGQTSDPKSGSFTVNSSSDQVSDQSSHQANITIEDFHVTPSTLKVDSDGFPTQTLVISGYVIETATC